MRKLVLVFSLITLIYSCKSNSDRSSDKFALGDLNLEEEVMPITRQMKQPTQPPSSVSENSGKILQIEKKIIKDASVSVEVLDYKAFRVKLDSVIRALNGYISNENLYNNDESLNCVINIRIPASNFEKFLLNLETGVERILNKNVSSRDVTAEFIDIEARLHNKKSVEKRYVQLLLKARNVKDILEIEEKLRFLREEIESSQGRLNYLNSQVSYSTIDLNAIQKIEYKFQPSKGKNFFQLLIKSLDKGWKGLLQFVLFLFKLWPFILIIIVLIYIYLRFRGRKKEKKHKKDK